ncbi:thermonuclease family protein [Candidatus Roizmanbacteria bacterium]|nr:thermonuclease family protein [Candidatus Roizmanbacteria bacterium]
MSNTSATAILKNICIILAILLLICSYSSSYASTHLVGKVVGVSDGDTITVLQNNQQYKIRLYGIDCPESGQAFGNKAKELTSSLVFGKTVDVTVYDIDKYQRSVGVVRVDGLNVNEAILKNGFAWKYTKYCIESFCNDWTTLEEQASRQGVGLWSDRDPMAPWDWRHSPQKEQQVESNAAGKLKQQATYKESVSGRLFHGNTNSHVYHNSGCQYYNCKNCTSSFNSGDDARKLGYRACQKCGG